LLIRLFWGRLSLRHNAPRRLNLQRRCLSAASGHFSPEHLRGGSCRH
jgi:hypothetical protein